MKIKILIKLKHKIEQGKNRFFLKKRGISIARKVDLSNVTIENYVNFAHHSQVSNSKIGLRTSIGRYTKVQFADIGKYCSISWDVTIGALDHPIHAVSTHAFSYRKQFGIVNEDKQIEHKEVFIGNDVWIGCGTIIMPGITIGDGAVIGAGAIVTHDVRPYEIVAGCPAKHISWRFSEEIIAQLMLLKWWDLPDSIIKENIEVFSPFKDITSDNSICETLNKIYYKKRESMI